MRAIKGIQYFSHTRIALWIVVYRSIWSLPKTRQKQMTTEWNEIDNGPKTRSKGKRWGQSRSRSPSQNQKPDHKQDWHWLDFACFTIVIAIVLGPAQQRRLDSQLGAEVAVAVTEYLEQREQREDRRRIWRWTSRMAIHRSSCKRHDEKDETWGTRSCGFRHKIKKRKTNETAWKKKTIGRLRSCLRLHLNTPDLNTHWHSQCDLYCKLCTQPKFLWILFVSKKKTLDQTEIMTNTSKVFQAASFAYAIRILLNSKLTHIQWIWLGAFFCPV